MYRWLLPAREATDAQTYVRSLELRHRDPRPQRPYTVANFVASVDGHATVDGQSRRLSAPADRELFYALRERVDAVLVGPRTLAAEHYKRMLPDPARRERRLAAGLPAEPLAVTVSRHGEIPRGIPLFADAPERVRAFTGEDVTLPALMRTLHDEHAVRTLLCEGGPMLFGALLRHELVDELLLTLAPSLVGGASGPAVVSGPPPEAPRTARLEGALERDGTLFLRYRF